MLNKKIYSFLSVLFLILMLAPLASDKYFDFILGIHIFSPIIFGVLGVFFGLIGVKGLVKIYIVAANLFVLGFFVLVTFMGIYGFQQP